MRFEGRKQLLTGRQSNVPPPRESGHFRTEWRPSLLANIGKSVIPDLPRRVISKAPRELAPPRADFSEADRQVFHGAIAYSDLEPNSDYVFALVEPGIAPQRLRNRSIGMGTGITPGTRRFRPQPIVEDAPTRPGGPICKFEFKRAYHPAG